MKARWTAYIAPPREPSPCWGFNSTGQLGDGTIINKLSPVSVLGGYRFTSLDGGQGHTCGIASSGLKWSCVSPGHSSSANGLVADPLTLTPYLPLSSVGFDCDLHRAMLSL